MNFISKLVTTGFIIATSTFAGVEPAQAAQCVYGQGYQMCFQMTGKSGRFNRWDVQLRNNHTTENMTVTCNGKYVDDWSSYGGFNQSEAQYMANYFCSL